MKNFIINIRKIRLELLITVLCGLITAYYLFAPPQIGLADSADFGRIYSRIGLSHAAEIPEDKFFNFFNVDYHVKGMPKIPVKIAQVIPLISVGVNSLFQPADYSIFYLSAIYYFLLLGGFYLLLRNAFYYLDGKVRKTLFGLLSVVVLSDIMFVSYLNSFYQEALFIITALFITALAIAPKINYNLLLPLLVILSLSKPQFILFLIFPLGLSILKFRYISKFVLLGTGLVLIFFTFFLFKDQAQLNKPNLYEAVFLGLMITADRHEQQKIVRQLDLKEEGYLVNVNKGYWRPDNELIENKKLFNEFYSEVKQSSVLKAYLLNPDIFFKTFFKGINVLTENSAQPQNLGNLTKKHSLQKKKTLVQSLWGTYLNYLAIPVYAVALFLGLSYLNDKKIHNPQKLHLILLIWIPIVYTATFVAGGINDFVKHNLAVYYMISILFLLCCLKVVGSRKKAAEKSEKKSSKKVLLSRKWFFPFFSRVGFSLFD